MKIAFFGTDQFATGVLKKLADSKYEPDLVITKPDVKANRGQKSCEPPVKKRAKKLDKPLLQPENLKKTGFLNRYKKKGVDLAVVSDYGKIMPAEVLTSPKYGTLSVHPSLLPRYRGATPIQTAILEGAEKTGVTIFVIDSKIDHGPIIAQDAVLVDKLYYQELSKRLVKTGTGLLKTVIPKWVDHTLLAKPQDDSKATQTEQFTKQEGKIDWSQSREKIERKIRALSECLGTYTFFTHNNKKCRLKILRAEIPEIELRNNQKNSSPGTVFNIKGRLIVKTKESCLELKKVQPEHRDRISGKDFLNGYQEVKKFA